MGVTASGVEKIYTWCSLGEGNMEGVGEEVELKAGLVGRGTVALQALKGQKMSDRTGWSHMRLMT